MPNRITIIGHPLAAAENRLAFDTWSNFTVEIILPKIWKARSLGKEYSFKQSEPESGDSPDTRRFHPLPVLFSGRNSLFLWVGLGRMLKRLRPDLIYCWEEPWCLATWQVGRLARSLGIPLVFYSAENRPKSLPWPFTLLQKFTYQTFTHCVTPTLEIAKRLRASGYTGMIFEIPLWIRDYRNLKADPSLHRLAFLGRLIPLKRVHIILQSLQALPDFHLRIIGDGPEGVHLRALSLELGLQDRVEFLGHIDNGELESALSGVSLLILPTGENVRQAEQFGKAVLEGISCGLPVLASNTGNLLAWAANLPTVTARNLDSPEKMVNAISDIWKAYPGHKALEDSRLQVQNLFGYQSVARQLESAFHSILPQAPAL